MTCSIVACDPETGQYGVVVASQFFAVGALVPHIRDGKCVIVTQAFVNPMFGIAGAMQLVATESADAVLTDMTLRDEGRLQRRIHMIDNQGRAAMHTALIGSDMWSAMACRLLATCLQGLMPWRTYWQLTGATRIGHLRTPALRHGGWRCHGWRQARRAISRFLQPPQIGLSVAGHPCRSPS